MVINNKLFIINYENYLKIYLSNTEKFLQHY